MEKIRALAESASILAAKGAEETSKYLSEQLAAELMGLSIDEAVPLTRACGHYLNLTAIAELHHK